MRKALVAIACALALAGCKRNKQKEQSYLALGQQVAPAEASDLRLSPDGRFAFYLENTEKPHLEGIPPQMRLGELHVVPTAGGQARKVGNGVTNMPGGYTFSPDSRWVFFLSGYNAASQAGTLQALEVADPGSQASTLGENVSYVLASPDSKQVAFVDGGVLKVGPLPAGPFQQLSGEVQTADFTPDSHWLVYKRRLTAAGGMFVWNVDGKAPPIKLGEQAGDREISPDSKRIAFSRRSETAHSTYDLFLATAPEWKVKQVATGVGVFAFSPDGKWLGRTEGQRPDELGDLMIGPADGSAGRKLGSKVEEFSFSQPSDAVAWLDQYDISARAGILAVASLPDGKPKQVGSRVPNFGWAPDGKSVAFISRFLKPIYSVDLMLYTMGADAAFKLNPGVFGYEYDPKGRYLLFRTNCLNEGRACDLMKTDLSKPKEPALKAVEAIYTFRLSENGDRVLVTYARRDSKLYDAAVYDVPKNVRKTVAQHIDLPALFTRDGQKVVYVVAGQQAPGVYVASDLP